MIPRVTFVTSMPFERAYLKVFECQRIRFKLLSSIHDMASNMLQKPKILHQTDKSTKLM